MFRKYVGIPFVSGGRDFDGCDCYGLLILIYKNERDWRLFDIENYNEMWYRENNYLLDNCCKQWKKIDIQEIMPFDTLMFRIGVDVPTHVGMYIGDNKFIHSLKRIGYSTISKLDRIWKSLLVGVYRYKGV